MVTVTLVYLNFYLVQIRSAELILSYNWGYVVSLNYFSPWSEFYSIFFALIFFFFSIYWMHIWGCKGLSFIFYIFMRDSFFLCLSSWNFPGQALLWDGKQWYLISSDPIGYYWTLYFGFGFFVPWTEIRNLLQSWSYPEIWS